MASNRSPKLLKREKVVTFEGEDMFIVKKPNGIGQPTNDEFVQVAGSIKPLADQPSMTNTDVVGLDATTSTVQVVTPTRTSASISPTTTTTTPTTPVSTETVVLPPKAPTPTETLLSQTKETVTQVKSETPSTTMTPEQLAAFCKKYPNAPQCSTTAVSDESIISTPPTFPNWSSLDCPTLDTEIKKLEVFMATQKFTNAVADACNSELAKAKSLYGTKCVTPPPPPPPPPPPQPQPQPQPEPQPKVEVNVGTPFFGGGGFGGGLGERPQEEEQEMEKPSAPIEEKKSKNWLWLILLLAAAGGYYLYKKNKK